MSFAREAGVELSLDDFDKLSESIPVISKVIQQAATIVIHKGVRGVVQQNRILPYIIVTERSIGDAYSLI